MKWIINLLQLIGIKENKNSVANPDAKRRFGVKGYPTLLYVKDN